MRRKILYNILNEWRDDDMDDSPIDLDDDIDIEPTSSDMDNEPDLDDDDFALSTTQETSYEYFPETKEELKEIVRMEIEKQGGVDVNLNMIDMSKITDMNIMFNKYTSLQNLDVSGWNVSNVKYMNGMFNGCKSLDTDTTMWKIRTNNIDNMYYNAPRIKHN